jgi:hypothetical protein
MEMGMGNRYSAVSFPSFLTSDLSRMKKGYSVEKAK